MAFDRSKYKATSVAAAKQADQEVAAITGSKEKGPNADYINIPAKDKNNKKISGSWNLRIYPPHLSDGGILYAVPKGVHWLPCEVPKKDKQGNFIKDGEKNVMEIKNRPVFNARLHGSKKKDIVEEYIAFANQLAKDNFPDTEKDFERKRKEFMAPINGGFGSEYDGILMRQTWVMYVDQLLEGGKKLFGRLEIGKAVKDRLNKIAATESASEPLGTDPFTDLEEGRAITITYDKDATKSQDYYSTEIYAPLIAGGKGMIKLFPLTDEDMEKFEEYPSLKKMFVDVYDSKTFNKYALPGLKMFDDEHELGVFGYDTWLDVVEELSAEFPDNEEESGEENDNDPNKDKFDKMDRDELKEFNREEKLGLIINKSVDDDQFRDMIRKVLEDRKPAKSEEKEIKGSSKADLPWEKEEDKKEEVVADKKVSSSVQARLDKLKKKNA